MRKDPRKLRYCSADRDHRRAVRTPGTDWHTPACIIAVGLSIAFETSIWMAKTPALIAAVAGALCACGPALEHADRAPAGNRSVKTEPIAGDAGGGFGSTDGCAAGRRILLNEAVNARDLGGVRLKTGERVACGVVFRGGPLSALSDVGCAEFAQRGVQTVVDLRTSDEWTGTNETACVLTQSRVLLAPMPVPYDVSPEDYLADLHATESVSAVFHALGDEAAYPLYFHCAIGRDRTGVVAALILLALGAPRPDIVDEYMLSRDAGVGAYPDSLSAVLDEIETRGGIEPYLAGAGVSSEELSTLRARLAAD